VHKRGLHPDLLAILLFAALALVFFFPVTLGGKTMLPADNVFAWEPWKSYAAQVGVDVPHNGLVLDLYIQNYVWKQFIVESLRARELPLWNPYILGGVPFLAAGQHSALYPFSAVFYVLPLWAAYGWFAALHLFLAGAFTYFLARTLGVSRGGSVIAGVAFMFGGFMVIRNVFPMIVAAAVWLPLILAVVERIVRQGEQTSLRPGGYIPWLVLGALGFGMVCLAGHPEMYYYVGIAAALFAAWRLAGLALHTRHWGTVVRTTLALAGMALVGVGLGSAQWLPLLDLVQHNFREGAVTLEEVLGWAYPPRRIISLLMPDFFGNPTHHDYLDVYTWDRVRVTVNALGEPIQTIYWGIKNYVEGASYVGVLPLLLAGIAVLRPKGRHVSFFLGLGAVSLAFMFGSRLYWVIFQLPGLNQVHSPFRWVYLYTLSIAVLAGMGVDALGARGNHPVPAPDTEGSSDLGSADPDAAEGDPRGGERSWNLGAARLGAWLDRLATTWVPATAVAGGLAVLTMLGLSLVAKERAAELAERVMMRMALAPQAFSDGRMFYSYQFRNLLIFGVALLAAGVVLTLRRRAAWRRVWVGLAVLVVFGELYVIGHEFFPAVDPSLVGYRTPVVDFLLSEQDPYRITAYVGSGEKTFDANSGMLFGIQDARGYDSIIPRRYVEFMQAIAEQGELPYNRIAPIFEDQAEALDAPLLDLLNVRYVLASRERPIDRPNYELVYDGEVLVYENLDALPRAFMVPRARVVGDPAELRDALATLEPGQVVLLEEEPTGLVPPDGSGSPGVVTGIEHGNNEVFVRVSAHAPGYLVLGDAYFDGWLAFIRPAESNQPAEDERALHIYRANGVFRAVEVPPGEWLVRFKYSPDPVKYGLYGSFVAGIILLLGLGAWAWMRLGPVGSEAGVDAARLVTRNTLAPMTLTLLNRGIDMVFAMLWLRILGPADAGQYGYAVAIIAWLDILTGFGLNTLVTREVARDRSQASRLLTNSTLLRLGLSVLVFPLLGAFFLLRSWTTPLDPRTMVAIWLFALALLPSNVSAGLSAVFMGYERMEVPAFVSTLSTLLKVVLGGLVLLLGGTFVGLAGVSIGVSVLTLGVFYYLVRRLLFRPRLEVDVAFQRVMLRESYPLMLNNLLATLFFKVAILLLEWQVRDARVLGWYNTSYKYIDAVGVIPAYFTMAIFPLMSRYAEGSKDALLRAYRLAIKLLVMAAIPLAFAGWFLAEPLIGILGGSQYLPQGADILRVMIWYMPIGFINSVTQYVLIALNQQRFLTRAFALGLAFSFLANLVGIGVFGYMASAYVTVVAEIVLLIPFYMGIRRHLAPIPWARLLWRHAVCAVPLGALALLAPGSHRLAALLLGMGLYVIGVLALGVLDREERRIVRRGLPLGRLQSALAGLVPGLVDRGTGQG